MCEQLTEKDFRKCIESLKKRYQLVIKAKSGSIKYQLFIFIDLTLFYFYFNFYTIIFCGGKEISFLQLLVILILVRMRVLFKEIQYPIVYAELHILGGITGTCKQSGLRYMPGLIFWVGKQILAIGQVSVTFRASYFEQENRYLQSPKQIPVAGTHQA